MTHRLVKLFGYLVGIVAGIRLIFAYIDPNTGGMLFQFLAVLLASFTGMLLFFSRQFRFTIAKLKRSLRRTENSATAMSDISETNVGNEKS